MLLLKKVKGETGQDNQPDRSLVLEMGSKASEIKRNENKYGLQDSFHFKKLTYKDL